MIAIPLVPVDAVCITTIRDNISDMLLPNQGPARRASLKDKGLVVIIGCGHAGIENIVRYAQKLTGKDKVYAVLGGFYLYGPLFEPILSSVVEALMAFSPDFLMPGNRTGWRATHRIAAAIPEAFIQGSVGTRLEL